jgi:hypothetical protein
MPSGGGVGWLASSREDRGSGLEREVVLRVVWRSRALAACGRGSADAGAGKGRAVA